MSSGLFGFLVAALAQGPVADRFGRGTLIGGVLLTPAQGWQVLHWVGALSMPLAVVLQPLLPEAVRFLVARGHMKEAPFVGPASPGARRAVSRRDVPSAGRAPSAP